ncbi:MAG: AbrB/MazE/SpoVT family DNA-binding domain-containing protein [Akkermansiaceae bacterium]|nr:AbrB/MazE/SpoVT family DNA-binding domain-containing protein [Akkermansiaceae bacterium]NNM27954.1 AbrB/MazE/SpoVT family DNA-binding domain-containing protein [Akkermansiaceae bacterium]
MKATLTSKGQITIPVKIRERLHLEPGDVLEFDEEAPFLKATKAIAPEAWEEFGRGWKDPWPGRDLGEVLEELRGPVELPPGKEKQ